MISRHNTCFKTTRECLSIELGKFRGFNINIFYLSPKSVLFMTFNGTLCLDFDDPLYFALKYVYQALGIIDFFL